MIINDISGGCEAMYEVVRTYGVPYIWTLCGDLSLPSRRPEMEDLDLILDPGFGFIGSEADFDCMRQMHILQQYRHHLLFVLRYERRDHNSPFAGLQHTVVLVLAQRLCTALLGLFHHSAAHMHRSILFSH